MKDKNIKNQALGNDSLENVSGGYYFESDDPYAQYGFNRMHLSQEEEDYLSSKGIDPSKLNKRNLWKERRAAARVLEAGGFKHKSPWSRF